MNIEAVNKILKHMECAPGVESAANAQPVAKIVAVWNSYLQIRILTDEDQNFVAKYTMLLMQMQDFLNNTEAALNGCLDAIELEDISDKDICARSVVVSILIRLNVFQKILTEITLTLDMVHRLQGKASNLRNAVDACKRLDDKLADLLISAASV